jgi:hypothetical protein
VGDESAVSFEGPGRVVREVAGRARQAAEDDGRAQDRLFADNAHERRGHPDELLGAFATLELAVAARQLDGDILGANRGRLLGVVRLQRRHEGLRGSEWILHSAIIEDVRHARSLLPYVAAAAVIAVGSVALVYATVDAESPEAGLSGTAGAAQKQLSSLGRLAYWRQSPSGAFVLWAANLDGSGARSLTTLAPNTSRPFGTRWTGNGSAVAYVTDTGIGVIKLDGTRTDIPVPAQVRNSGFRVIDQRWSPSGMRVAATLQRSTDGKTEMYLGSLDRRELVRSGDLGNAFAGDWLSEDEVLVESDTGVLGALRQPGEPIRKLVDRSAASPFFDGVRILFLAGSVSTTGTQSGIFVASPSVWSVRPDGQDLRPEGRLEVAGSLRLDGVWPDARYLMHVGADQTQYLIGPRSTSLAPSSLLRRAVVSADHRVAIGFGGSRVVRIDLTRGLSPAESAFVVLLDGIISADAWIPKSGVR